MSQAINSGQINVTSFPGAEAGASLVEMTGEVLVTCAVSSISLRLTGAAITEPRASVGLASTTKRAGIGGDTTCSAVTVALALSKVKAFPSVEASAAAVATANLLRKVGASTTSRAATSATGTSCIVLRSAVVIASASGAGASKKNAYRGAAIEPTAITQASALRKLRFGASTSGACTSSVDFVLAHRIAASPAVASAAGSADSYRKRTTGAFLQPGATSQAAAIFRRLFSAQISAEAKCSDIAARQKTKYLPSGGSGFALTQAALVLRYLRSAQISAGAVSSSASTYRKIILGATSQATSNAQAAIVFRRTSSAQAFPAAACAGITAHQKIHYQALDGFGLASIRAGIVLLQATGAETMARAIANSAAADYGSAMPAPEERRMLVSASDRRMEVTT